MLFHVIAKHNWETCEGNATNPSPMVERNRWVEGNDDIKVVGAWVNHPSHTVFAVVEANDYESLRTFFRPASLKGEIQVLPVGDQVASRKDAGDWGK